MSTRRETTLWKCRVATPSMYVMNWPTKQLACAVSLFVHICTLPYCIPFTRILIFCFRFFLYGRFPSGIVVLCLCFCL